MTFGLEADLGDVPAKYPKGGAWAEYKRMLSANLLRVVDNSVFRQFVVYSANLAEAAEGMPPDPRIRWASHSDKDALIEAGMYPRLLNIFLQGCCRVAVLEHQGKIIGRNSYWLADIMSNGAINLKVPEGAIMAMDGYVEPAFRGRRYLAAIKAFAAREYLSAGYRTMISQARWRNRASARAHRQATANAVLRIVVIRGPHGLRLVLANRRFSIGKLSNAGCGSIQIPEIGRPRELHPFRSHPMA